MKILFIANYVPPVNGSAAIRALYYMNYLAELGHTVHLLTIDYPKDFIRYDQSLGEKISKKVSVYSVSPGRMYLKMYPKKGMQTSGGQKATFKGKAKSFIKQYLTIPDSYIGWVFAARQKGKELISVNQYDVMFSMHESPSSHLLAYFLKKYSPELPWVAYWSDPWSLDPSRKKNSALRKKIDFWLETTVIKKANRYLFTTDETRKMYVDIFQLPYEATEIVYRGFDREIYADIKNRPNILKSNKINFVYTGDIYTNLRDVQPFMQALKELQEKQPLIYESLQIYLIGFIDDESVRQQLLGFEYITLLNRVPYEDALAYTVQADVLILWGNKNSNQIPGKVYEYLGTESTILTILGDGNDPLKPMLRRFERGPIIENSSEQIIRAITEIVTKVKEETVPVSWNKVAEEFEWKNVVIDLANKLQIR